MYVPSRSLIITRSLPLSRLSEEKCAAHSSGTLISADMLTLNQPPLTQHISIPKDMSQLSCEAFTAGIVEGVLDGLDVVCSCLIKEASTKAD